MVVCMPSWHMQFMDGSPAQHLVGSLLHSVDVLCYGHDPLLLLTRERILKRLGYSCSTVMTVRDYQQALLRRTPGVILLCQTLDSEECSQAARLTAVHAPSSRLVVMYSVDLKCVPDNEYVLLPSGDGPEIFSRTMSNLLGRLTGPPTSRNAGLP